MHSPLVTIGQTPAFVASMMMLLVGKGCGLDESSSFLLQQR
jgi:hypothetical protein